METKSAADSSRIPLNTFPVYPITNESEWWSQHVSSNNVERLSLGDLYEGRLVTRRGEFWAVLNGSRRGFPSYDTFLKMGFENDMAFPLTLAQVRSLPEGERLPVVSGGSSSSSSSSNSSDPHPLYQNMLGMGIMRGRRGKRGTGAGSGTGRGQARGPGQTDVDMR